MTHLQLPKLISIILFSLANNTRIGLSVLILACFIFTVTFSAGLNAQVNEVTASVDRNSILLDESMRLTIIATGNTTRDAADFSALQNNFRVSVPSFSQSTQIINGNMTRTVSWAVTLYPKQAGTFNIPAFTVEGKQTKAFAVSVLPVSAANQNQPRQFFATAELNNTTIYLQQQLLYTVKVYLARDIQRGQITIPELEGALIEQIGEDEDYQEIIDGVRYRIIERNYAIIPQSSGKFTIKGPIFEAEVLTNSRRSFANFGRTTSISRRAPDLDIEVRPMPNNYQYTWLPSALVDVTEQWQTNGEELTVGEPITRSITLTVLGLTKEQLPTIDLPYHPSFKVYPEQPNLTTSERNDTLIAQGVFNSAIIPEQTGSFVLPEVRIPWFNVNTGQTEFAVVPARTVEVLAKPSNAQTAIETNDAQSSTQNPAGSENIAPPTLSPSSPLTWLSYVLIASNVFTLLAFYVYWLMNKNRHKQTPSVKATTTSTTSENDAFVKLKHALEQGNSQAVPALLENWLKRLHKQQFYSVSANLANDHQSDALDQYNGFLATQYSDSHDKFDFTRFIKSLEAHREAMRNTKDSPVLNELYPSL